MSTIELEPVDYYCQYCDSAMEATGCTAPHCPGYRCMNCRAGCDLEELDDGFCGMALADLSWAQAEEIREEALMRRYYRRPIRTVHLPDDAMTVRDLVTALRRGGDCS